MFIENFAAKTLSQIISGLEEEALLFIEIYFQNINSSPKASGTGLGKISVIRLDHFWKFLLANFHLGAAKMTIL